MAQYELRSSFAVIRKLFDVILGIDEALGHCDMTNQGGAASAFP